MTRVKMKFNLIFNIDNTEDLDSMGGELSLFFQESLQNGEDYLKIEYSGSELLD